MLNSSEMNHSHTSHNAPVPYPTRHYSEQKLGRGGAVHVCACICMCMLLCVHASDYWDSDSRKCNLLQFSVEESYTFKYIFMFVQSNPSPTLHQANNWTSAESLTTFWRNVVKFDEKFILRNCIWKCHLKISIHFVLSTQWVTAKRYEWSSQVDAKI